MSGKATFRPGSAMPFVFKALLPLARIIEWLYGVFFLKNNIRDLFHNAESAMSYLYSLNNSAQFFKTNRNNAIEIH